MSRGRSFNTINELKERPLDTALRGVKFMNLDIDNLMSLVKSLDVDHPVNSDFHPLTIR